MDRVHALDCFAPGFRGLQLVVRMNAPDDQDSALHFNFTGDFRSQPAVAGVNLARFQRTAKSAGQSPAGCGYHIIQRGCTRRKFFGRNLVVSGNF